MKDGTSRSASLPETGGGQFLSDGLWSLEGEKGEIHHCRGLSAKAARRVPTMLPLSRIRRIAESTPSLLGSFRQIHDDGEEGSPGRLQIFRVDATYRIFVNRFGQRG